MKHFAPHIIASTIALLSTMRAQDLSEKESLILCHLSNQPDKSSTMDQLNALLKLPQDGRLHAILVNLIKRGLVLHTNSRGEAGAITITEAGDLAVMGMVGAVMLNREEAA